MALYARWYFHTACESNLWERFPHVPISPMSTHVLPETIFSLCSYVLPERSEGQGCFPRVSQTQNPGQKLCLE